MKAFWHLCYLLICTQFVICRDFYMGMFKRNDYLVAQDVIFKEASHYGSAVASYGRFFKCPITFFRVVDRLGMGRGPYTSIVRGGLRKKFITVRIKSTYNLPISVNIYVGCENKSPSTIKRISREPSPETTTSVGTTSGGDEIANTTANIVVESTVIDGGSEQGNSSIGNSTDADGGAEAEPETPIPEP